MGKTIPLMPGLRFRPTDVELVMYFLKRKVLGKTFPAEAIAEVDIYKHDPWDLPAKSCSLSRDLIWYFFSPREKKYGSGPRIKRATEFGFWKTTGNDRSVKYDGKVVGMIKTLVFHRGRAPNGERTNWVMHEYRLEDESLNGIQDSYVLCVIFQKDGLGPKNGAQYGARFREEDWMDDEEANSGEIDPSVKTSAPNGLELDRDCAAVSSHSRIPQINCLGSYSESCILKPSHHVQPSNDAGPNNSVASSSHAPNITSVVSVTESYMSDVVAPSCKLPQPISNNDIVETDISLMLSKFVDGGPFLLKESDKNKATIDVDPHDVITWAGSSVRADFFEDLDFLGDLPSLDEDEICVSNTLTATQTFEEMVSGDHVHFLELWDLSDPLVSSTGDGNVYNQVDMAESLAPGRARGSEEYRFNTCTANDVDMVQPCSMLPGMALGLEDYKYNSRPAAPNLDAQNHSHSLPP